MLCTISNFFRAFNYQQKNHLILQINSKYAKFHKNSFKLQKIMIPKLPILQMNVSQVDCCPLSYSYFILKTGNLGVSYFYTFAAIIWLFYIFIQFGMINPAERLFV